MLKITGLKKIAGESRRLLNGTGNYLQLNYDRSTGEAWTNLLSNHGCNDWVVYDDNNIVNCGNILYPATMAKIRDMIETTMEFNDWLMEG